MCSIFHLCVRCVCLVDCRLPTIESTLLPLDDVLCLPHKIYSRALDKRYTGKMAIVPDFPYYPHVWVRVCVFGQMIRLRANACTSTCRASSRYTLFFFSFRPEIRANNGPTISCVINMEQRINFNMNRIQCTRTLCARPTKYVCECVRALVFVSCAWSVYRHTFSEMSMIAK